MDNHDRVMLVVVTARRRAVVNVAMVNRVIHTVVHRVMHDNHATRLSHRQCRQRQGRYGQCCGNQNLLHETPLLLETRQA